MFSLWNKMNLRNAIVEEKETVIDKEDMRLFTDTRERFIFLHRKGFKHP